MAIIGEIYEALTDEDAFALLPQRLAALVGARSGSIQAFGLDGSLQAMVFSYFTPEMFDYYVATEMYRLDVWREPASRPHALNTVIDSGDLLTMDRYLKSEFFNRFFREFGDDTTHCLGSVMTHDQGVSLLGLHRGRDDQPFSPSEVARITPLVPHLRRLIDVRMTLQFASQRALLSQGALDAQVQAVFVTDGEGHPLLLNRAAERLLAAGSGLAMSGGRLRAANKGQDDRLTAAIATAEARQDVCGGTLAVSRPGAPALRVVVSPWTIGERTRVMVVIHDILDRNPDVASTLVSLYGLTAAEAQTVALLDDGLSPIEAAHERQVSVATVRSQIQQAMRKTGASGIGDLLRQVATLPRRGREEPGPSSNANRIGR